MIGEVDICGKGVSSNLDPQRSALAHRSELRRLEVRESKGRKGLVGLGLVIHMSWCLVYMTRYAPPRT